MAEAKDKPYEEASVLLQGICSERGWTSQALARKLGIPAGTLRAYQAGWSAPRVRDAVLDRMERELGREFAIKYKAAITKARRQSSTAGDKSLNLAERLIAKGRLPEAQWISEHFHRTSIYVGRSLTEVQVTKTIRATVDGLQTVTAKFKLQRDGDSSRLKCYQRTRCTLERLEPIGNGVVEALLKFARPLMQGERQTFSYTWSSVDSETESPPYIYVRANEDKPIEHLLTSVQFDTSCLPVVAWHIDGLQNIVAPGSPETCPKIDLDSSGYIEVEFTQLIPSLCYGIGWCWPDGS